VKRCPECGGNLARSYSLIIFDADGTLRRCTIEGQPCPNDESQWELIPGVLECLNSLEGDPACFIASNQAGVAFGYMSFQVAKDLLMNLAERLRRETALRPWGVRLCPHHANATERAFRVDCACRKPRPGMLYEIMVVQNIGPGETLYVGDMESDKRVARAAGCGFVWAFDFFNRD